MTCSLEIYRIRIGTYNNRQTYRRKYCTVSGSGNRLRKINLLVRLLIAIYTSTVVSLPVLLKSPINSSLTWQIKPCSSTLTFIVPKYQISSSDQHYPLTQVTSFVHPPANMSCQFDIWDPGDASIQSHPWIFSLDWNKIAHITFGNRGQRGKGITCVYWNKGPAFLHNKITDIESIVQSHKPQIFGLGEANFRRDHDIEAVQLPGYNLHLDSCMNNPSLGMARVCVYTHESLRVKRRSDLEDDTIAAVWLECGLPNQQGLLVCVGYRQWRLLGQGDNTSGTVQAQFTRWSTFLDKWQEALYENKEVVVTLDANLDHLTWRSTEDLPPHHSSVRLKSLVDAVFDRIIPLGVTQLVTGATRIERGQPRAGLDHLYSNRSDRLSQVQTFFTGVSDHKLLKVTRYTKSYKELPRYVKKRTFKNFDEDKFKDRIEECRLEDIYSCSNVDIAAELLTNKITHILDDMAPIKRFQTRTKYAPWLSNESKQLIAEREAAQQKASLSDNPEDWRAFRALRNQVTSKSREDKRKWEKMKLDPSENNSTDVWKTVRGWLGWGSAGTPSQLFWEGKLVSSPRGLSTTMNNFFLDKIKRLRSGIPEQTADPLVRTREAMAGRQCSFKLNPVDVSQVLKVIKGMKNSSATGIDYIDTRTVKLVADHLAPVLTHIINLSIETATFPNIWKWAKVVPLLKSGTCDKILPKSYRPVALLPVMSKVLEKVVFSQLVEYLEENHLIHPNLHGSRSGHNTSTALNQLYDKWVEEVEAGNMVGVLFCDQSAAFDLCDHNILLSKLELMGVEGISLKWIESYLSHRKQSCFVDGEMSAPLNLLDCGVPQGSIGGPLLWVCFTCDQPDAIHDHQVEGHGLDRGCRGHQQEQGGSVAVPGGDCGELVGYVDDGAFSYSHTDPSVLSRVLTEKYNMLEEWMSNSRLVINPDKTHMMVMGGKKVEQSRKQITMKAGSFIIKTSESEKLLGGIVHQSLKWNQHLRDSQSSLVRQLTSRINGLKIISSSAGFSTRLMIANGAVQSRLVYLITVWGGSSQYLLRALQVQQLNAARTVCGFHSRWWSKSRLLKQVGWLSVRQLIFYHTALQAYKTMTTGVPRPLYSHFSTNNGYRTRSVAQGDIKLRDDYRSVKTFKYRAMTAYNSIPVDVRTGTQSTVKKKLKMWVKKNIPLDLD